ncbi:TerC/Alx family metal homeostasis membrane protein [bacterium]|nr:TerC/Alx family metal homeostasis membrane protein [bacterium]
MPPKTALRWVIFWLLTATGFSFLIGHFVSQQKQMEFLTCYVVEWSLSLDNLFVFLMIFKAFSVEGHRQVRVLWWGIIGAMVLRMVFIMLGVALIKLFEPVLILFGLFLIYTAYKMAFSKHDDKDITKNKLVMLVRRRFRVTENFVGEQFFTRRQGVLFATPMFLVLVAIESSDVVFAVDSIPAAFAITRDPLIIYTANIFAILGLRALFFLLSHADQVFNFLKYGVALILAFVGFKMLAAHYVEINQYLSLGIIVVSLTVSIILSVILSNKKNRSS